MKIKKIIITIIILLYGQNLPSSGYIMQTSEYAELDKIVFQEIYQLQIFFHVFLTNILLEI